MNPFHSPKLQRPRTEIERILALPRAPRDYPDLTARYARKGGAMQLRPIQSAALAEIERCGGLLGAIGVGLGKTLIALLAPLAILNRHGFRQGQPPPKTLILVPAALREQMLEDLPRYAKHFEIPQSGTHIRSYAWLSKRGNENALEDMRPDLIVCDEAHKLRNPKSSRTRRIMRYMRAHPETHFVALSGTLTTRSLYDYAHLAAWALKERSPLPLKWAQLNSWAQAIDVGGIPSGFDLATVKPLVESFGGSPRTAFFARLSTAAGVVTTPERTLRASLAIGLRALQTPPAVSQAYNRLEGAWEVASFELDSALRVAAYKRQISQGFYYRWVWPDGSPDYAWLEARAVWRSAVAQARRSSRAEYDSPADLFAACVAGLLPTPELAKAWAVWEGQHHKPEPETETVWLSDFLVNDAVRWLGEGSSPRILWYSDQALETALTAQGVRCYGRGTQAPVRAERCAMSIWVHGTGRNLQAWHRCLVLCPPSNGAAWEQLLGRTHREGQEADCCYWEVYQHTDAFVGALESARRDARYIQETHGSEQRLNYAGYYHSGIDQKQNALAR